MRFEWDAVKAERNFTKHGIAFSDAVEALKDPRAITMDDENADEERYIAICMDAFARLLVVVYTWRGRERLRLISARRATRIEHRQYAGGGA